MRTVYSNQLRAGRAMLGWSVQDLADRSGVSVAMVKRGEASPGEPDLKLDKVAALCGALHASGIVFTQDMSRIGVALDLRKR